MMSLKLVGLVASSKGDTVPGDGLFVINSAAFSALKCKDENMNTLLCLMTEDNTVFCLPGNAS